MEELVSCSLFRFPVWRGGRALLEDIEHKFSLYVSQRTMEQQSHDSSPSTFWKNRVVKHEASATMYPGQIPRIIGMRVVELGKYDSVAQSVHIILIVHAVSGISVFNAHPFPTRKDWVPNYAL